MRCYLSWKVIRECTEPAIQEMVDDAELRHYLACLASSSRSFSRCPYSLECALRLFVYCYKRRQLYKQLYPAYPAHIKDSLDPLF
jgi:hypothetical protein